MKNFPFEMSLNEKKNKARKSFCFYKSISLPPRSNLINRQVSWLVYHLTPWPSQTVALSGFILTYSSGGCSGFTPLSLLTPKRCTCYFHIHFRYYYTISCNSFQAVIFYTKFLSVFQYFKSIPIDLFFI